MQTRSSIVVWTVAVLALAAGIGLGDTLWYNGADGSAFDDYSWGLSNTAGQGSPDTNRYPAATDNLYLEEDGITSSFDGTGVGSSGGTTECANVISYNMDVVLNAGTIVSDLVSLGQGQVVNPFPRITLNNSSVWRTRALQDMYIGTVGNGDGEVTVNDSASLEVGDQLFVGYQTDMSHPGILTVNGGTVTATSELVVGYQVVVGGVGYGRVVQTNGAVSCGNNFVLGYQDAESTGEYTISGGTLTVADGAGHASVGNYGQGTLTVSNGTVTIGGDGNARHLYIGRQAGSVGAVVQSDGSVILPMGNIYLGQSGTGSYALGGGTLDVTNGVLTIGDVAGSTGSMTISGGTLRVSALYPVVGNRGTGTVVQTGGTVVFDAGCKLGYNSGGMGTYEISGGAMSNLAYDLAIPASATAAGGVFRVRGGGATITAVNLYCSAAPSTLAFEVGANGLSAIDCSGNATFGADTTLEVSLADGYTPEMGSTIEYTAIAWDGTLSGEANVLPTSGTLLGGDATWTNEFRSGEMVITVSRAPAMGTLISIR